MEVEERTDSRADNLTSLRGELQRSAGSSASEFTKAEKNVVSIGFFSLSNKRSRNAKAKVVTMNRTVDGRKIEARATIVPGALYGLPNVADLEKYLAFQSIVNSMRIRQGEVTNPISFTSAEFLAILKKCKRSGKNYAEIDSWLNVMTATTIVSEESVYLAARKVLAKDRFHVFDRAVTVGKEIAPGVIADKNYIWLSQWQLDNINSNYLVPVDLETYSKLKYYTSKALVPLLQVWLYATRDEGCFEKRYPELCQILNIKEYKYLAHILAGLRPSLNELKAFEYIADWSIERTSDGQDYKIVLKHGAKFYRDRQRRLEQNPAQPAKDLLVEALVKRGIGRHQATRLLKGVTDTQTVLDQLEYGDHIVMTAESGRIRNPPGFYIYLIKDKIMPPDSFLTSRAKKVMEEAKEARAKEAHEEARLELEYYEFVNTQVDEYLKATYSEDDYKALVENKEQELLHGDSKAVFSAWGPDTLSAFAENQLRKEIASRLPIPTFRDFAGQQRPQSPVLNG
jgi:hypothetical protein